MEGNMKKIFLANVIILLITIGILLGMNARLSSAAGHSFAQVVPFYTGNGALAFFDQSDGKVYIYDQSFKKCILKLQVSQLGEPIELIESSVPKDNNRFGTSY